MPENGKSPRTLPALAAAFAEMTAARTAPEAIRSMTFKTVKKGFDQGDVTAYLDRLAGDVELLHNRIKQLEARAAKPVAEAAPPEEQAPAGSTTVETPASEPPDPFAAPAFAAPRAPEATLPRPPEPDVFELAGARIAELLRTFEDDVREAEAQAMADAEAIVAKARGEADDIRLEARIAREEAVADAAAMVSSARAEADRAEKQAQTRADEIEGAAQRAVREAQTRADEIMRAAAASRDGLLDDIRRMREDLVETLDRVDAVVTERPAPDRPAADRLVVVDDTSDDDARAR